MTRYLSEEEPTGKITITHEEAMRELGKIEDDYSEIRKLKKQIAEMHQADLNRLATIRLRLWLGRSVPLARSVALLSELILQKRRAGNANRSAASGAKEKP